MMHKEAPILTLDAAMAVERMWNKVPNDLQEEAREVLGGKETVEVTRKTFAGRRLLDWQKSEKDKRVRRNKEKRARKARRKSR